MGAAGESRRKGVWKEKGGGKVNEGQDEGKEGVKNCRRAELFWYQKIPNILLHFHKKSRGRGSYNHLRKKGDHQNQLICILTVIVINLTLN